MRNYTRHIRAWTLASLVAWSPLQASINSDRLWDAGGALEEWNSGEATQGVNSWNGLEQPGEGQNSFESWFQPGSNNGTEEAQNSGDNDSLELLLTGGNLSVALSGSASQSNSYNDFGQIVAEFASTSADEIGGVGSSADESTPLFRFYSSVLTNDTPQAASSGGLTSQPDGVPTPTPLLLIAFGLVFAWLKRSKIS